MLKSSGSDKIQLKEKDSMEYMSCPDVYCVLPDQALGVTITSKSCILYLWSMDKK